MLTKVYGSAVFGVDATTITVEVNVDKGIGYHLVGLPDNAIRESNFRIAAALQNNGFKIPGKTNDVGFYGFIFMAVNDVNDQQIVLFSVNRRNIQIRNALVEFVNIERITSNKSIERFSMAYV